MHVKLYSMLKTKKLTYLTNGDRQSWSRSLGAIAELSTASLSLEP